MNTKRKYPVIALLILHGMLFGAFDLTRQTAILIPEKALSSTRLSASELTEYVHRSTGVSLPTDVGSSTAENQIVIGTLRTCPGFPADLRARLEQAVGEDSFYQCCQGNRLYIIGKNRVGELYGTYQFLEERLGVRWFMAKTAEDDNEYVPKRSGVWLEDYCVFREPVFRYRHLTHSAATARSPVEGHTWAVRLGYQINAPWSFARAFKEEFYDARVANRAARIGGHLTFVDAIPQKLFDTHPEYFAFREGRRQKGQQYCLSNPDLQDRVYDHICRFFEEFPRERVNHLFGMIDTTWGWCECDACRKLDESATYDYANVSTRFHKVASAIADRIYRRYPDAQLLSWAYHTYRNIPRHVKYDPRLTLLYCIHGRCYGHGLADPSCGRNREHVERLAQWKKICADIWIYEYSTSTPLKYCPVELRQARDLRFYRSHGISGWKEELSFADADFWPRAKPGVYDERPDRVFSNWQWLYVTAKLLWNPDLDEHAILRDIESKYYGVAYPAMKKYHDYRRRLWENNPACLGYPTGDQRRPQLLNVPESKETLLAYLDEADKLAQGDPKIARRVKKDRFYLQRFWIEPNQEFRKKSTDAYAAPTRMSGIVIDGKADDGAWAGAFYTGDFKYIFVNKDQNVPEDQKTTLGILSDDHNLYFLATAKEPNPKGMRTRIRERDGRVYGDDGMEFFIMPPNAAQEYYHVSVNTLGAVYDSRCPGNRSEVDLGVTAACQVLKDRYVMEVQVPVKNIGRLKRGELWRIHATRNRTQSKESCFTSLDGVEHHDSAGYRGIVMGTPYLINGSFDLLDARQKAPKGWNGQRFQVVKTVNGHAVKLPPYSNIMQMLYMQFPQEKAERKINVSFKAHQLKPGKGMLNLTMLRYTDINDPKAEHGYRRKSHPGECPGSYQLTTTSSVYTARYTIRPDEWVGIMFSFIASDKTLDAVIDDISLSRE